MFWGIEPRVAPWAIASRPFGALEHGPRPLEEIEKDITDLEKEIMAMLKGVTS